MIQYVLRLEYSSLLSRATLQAATTQEYSILLGPWIYHSIPHLSLGSGASNEEQDMKTPYRKHMFIVLGCEKVGNNQVGLRRYGSFEVWLKQVAFTRSRPHTILAQGASKKYKEHAQ